LDFKKMIINELYQDVILEHNSKPINYYRMKDATHYSKGYNPFCGDNIEVFCFVSNNVIEKISFFGEGCAISKASASMMMSLIERQTIKEAMQIFAKFHKFLTGQNNSLDKYNQDLIIFKGVKNFPLRIKCATLAWHALRSSIKKSI